MNTQQFSTTLTDAIVWNSSAPSGSVAWVQSPLGGFVNSPRAAFMALWEEIQGEGSWAQDPWVVVPTFTVERTCKRRAIEAAGGIG